MRFSLQLTSLALVAVAALSCESGGERGVAVPGQADAVKTSALDRAQRRLYDGAPPVIPHEAFSSTCASCHNEQGLSLPGVGFAPPTPHLATEGMSAMSRCSQCHVFRRSDTTFVATTFEGRPQDLRRGARLNPLAPPVLPHRAFMRENCVACHSGPAAREPIRTPHPERVRCRQCHVEQQSSRTFPG
jgi:cytochrome c-type protein NapB